ncbi:MAG: T9SS type A sorting domain-containing protein [Lentimicrobiaceae bacterium]|nr:T9SS type A sorting domain-containing protein [Lentimicrobiaceae bacterium]
MITFFKKRYLVLLVGLTAFGQGGYSQEQLVPLQGNDVIKKAHKQFPKMQKSSQLIYYEPIQLPFVDDFSNYTGYPDTALWIGRQAYVNQSFAAAPPTIGCVTLDAVDERGFVYAHATTMPFPADTLLSRPIRLDSVLLPYPMLLTPNDSVYFSFYYQPGGGMGKEPWKRLGDAPESEDSLLLEFGYQTGNIVLLHYITDLQMIGDGDTLVPGDTLFSFCNPNLYIIVEDYLFPGDTLSVPCDSVNGMEVIWEKVWSDEGRTLDKFLEEYGDTFRQVMIPITDMNYFNRGFQFRFRNYASLEWDNNSLIWGSNVDYWNIDYVRLDYYRSFADTTIDDIAFVNNPGSILKKYTAMPYNQFKDNESAELIDTFGFIKLINLSSVRKNTIYEYSILDEDKNQIWFYNGENQNLDPYYEQGYQYDSAYFHAHTRPLFTMPVASIPDAQDSLLLFIQHIFEEQGSKDKRPQNDTVVYAQKFYNYYAYDDGTPEAGYVVTSSLNPYKKSLALEFTLNKPDTLRAIDIYLNHTWNNAAAMNFTLSVWSEKGSVKGMPGEELYAKEVTLEYSAEMYGFQRFYLTEPKLVSGKFFIGYQVAGQSNRLNIGFDQNTDAHTHTFWRTNGNWDSSFLVGTPMLRPVLGKFFSNVGVEEQTASFDVKLYPNPAKDLLYIALSAEIQERNITTAIYTVAGQKIYEQAYRSEVSISNLPPGLYLLQLTDNERNTKTIRKFSVVR